MGSAYSPGTNSVRILTRVGLNPLPQPAARREGNLHALRELPVDNELVGCCQKLLHGLHWPGSERSRDGMAIEIRILDDEVLPRSHQRRVKLQFALDVGLRMIRIQDRHHSVARFESC